MRAVAAVFPTAPAKFQSEVGLVSHDLRRHNSRDAHAFAIAVHQKTGSQAYQANLKNCGKLLKPKPEGWPRGRGGGLLDQSALFVLAVTD
jgi:hypothetical protein